MSKIAMTTLKDHIVHESLRLFSLNGFLSTGVNDILGAANTSKGGFYNHFGTKEELYYQVLAEAQRLWREKVLMDVDEIDSPVKKVKQVLANYSDQYLKDLETFPGGCIFITFSTELDDQRPHLAAEVYRGFVGFKALLKRYLDEGKARGELKTDVNTETVTELLFSGMLGASVMFGVDKSAASLDRAIGALIAYLEEVEVDAHVVPVADVSAP